MATSAGKKGSKGTELSEAAIFNNFQQMRKEQRRILTKIAELESDKNEHRLAFVYSD